MIRRTPCPCASPTGHCWHLGVLLCLPAAPRDPRASLPAVVLCGTGDICCLFTPRKQHLLGFLLSPRQARREPITPVPLRTSSPALCPQQGFSTRFQPARGWPELWGLTEQHSRFPVPCERRAEGSSPAPPCARTQPRAGTRHRRPAAAHSAHGRGAGVGGLMDIHEQRVR